MAIKGVKQLVEEANREIVTLEPSQAVDMFSAGDAVLVDIRDIRELQRDGKVPDAVHAPRGMVEFWFDPASPYHKPVFAQSGKTYVLFCAAGWRSALTAKTLKDMGFENIAHIAGGFGALKELGATAEPDHDWQQ
jgi:rhodanese-related sulfurtransferase